MFCCSTVREAAMQCIEELHAQLGQPVLTAVSTSGIKPRQLKELHARLGHLQAATEAVQDFPLFHAATKLLSHSSGSNSSRSDGSQQVASSNMLISCCVQQVSPAFCLPLIK